MELCKIRYGAEIKTDMGMFYCRKARPEDVGYLRKMYESCAIHRGNFRTRLKASNRAAFDRKGGMFVILSAEEIAREIENPHSLWAVMCGPDGMPAGSFWIGDRNDSVPARLKEENTAYPREIIVSGRYAGRHVGRMLYCTVFQALLEAGYDRSVCEVYRALACRDEKCLYETDMLNKPSYIDMLSLGGKYEGPAPVKELCLKGLTVWVEPHIFSFSHKKSVNLAEKEMKAWGISIVEDRV